jgi:hypothetical protein
MCPTTPTVAAISWSLLLHLSLGTTKVLVPVYGCVPLGFAFAQPAATYCPGPVAGYVAVATSEGVGNSQAVAAATSRTTPAPRV